MAFLAIRDALLSRLTGVTQTEVGVELRQRGKGLAVAERSSRNHANPGTGSPSIGSLLYPQAPLDSLRKVPVIPYDIAGRNVDAKPVLSVYLASTPMPRRDASYIHSDDIREVVESSKLVATFQDGTQRTGYSLIKERPHPRPYNYEFVLRAWASNETEGLAIAERLLDLLDERGYLRVTLKDGSEVTYDTMLNQSPVTIPVPAGWAEEGDAGEYSVLLAYTVEGYLDTTDQKALIRTIRERTLEGADFLDLDADPFITVEPDDVEPVE